ncbi:hypothetical protein [Haliangium sp.]|uniref:hypothetical protein n=1 Tax=Haliangium sp. TaxID=2663208 RepID=UPI003D0CC83A
MIVQPSSITGHTLAWLGLVGAALWSSVATAEPEPRPEPEVEPRAIARTDDAPNTADDAEVPEVERTPPWYVGVSSEQRATAIELYEAGNQLLEDALFAAAIAKYREARQHWNHPGIHYNLALAQVGIDRPLEAYRSILAALQHGPDALRAEQYKHALEYRRLLRHQIAEIVVTCNEPDAVVTLDGKPLLTGPGQVGTLMLPGKHQLVASKFNHISVSETVELIAGHKSNVELRLLSEDEATVHTRRWSPALPWAVVIVGGLIGGAGGVLQWQSNVTERRLSDLAPALCPYGCEVIPPSLNTLDRGARWRRNAAYASYATAGAALTTGAVLLYLNRARAVESPALQDLIQISLARDSNGGAGLVSVQLDF